MTKLRLLVFLLTIVVVGTIGTVAIFYARGYRLNKNTITPNGLFVANSDPTGAQLLVNNELKSATNATVTLPPGVYDVTIKKDGYIPWKKRIAIEKEIVTEVDSSLFPIAPSLSAITFSGASKPAISDDYSKIAYADSVGLWVIETINLPLGFSRQPLKITDGDLTSMSFTWSPDGRQILITGKSVAYLLDASKFTSQTQKVNIFDTLNKTRADWKDIVDKQNNSLLGKLPDDIKTIFNLKTADVKFSPDETKILYTASSSASIPTGLISPLPGSSSQSQSRDIKKDHKYVYDIKEDRNFEITDIDSNVYWFPTSRNLLIPQKDKVVIADYDNTNKQVVYAGAYLAPNAFPTPNTNRIFIVTNLGAKDSPPNLYSLNLK